jgi:hypothetical protein
VIQANQIDAEVLGRYLVQCQLSAEGSPVERAARLEMYFYERRTQMDVAQCDRCGGLSDAGLPECPYCGEQALLPKDEPPAQAPGTALAPATLDEEVATIRRSVRVAAENLYAVGTALRRIRDGQLWKARVNATGQPVHRGFYQFVEAEVGYKHAYASRLIGVCEDFDEAHLGRFGVTRLDVARRLPAAQREEFLEGTSNLPARGPELAAAARKAKGTRRSTKAREFPRMESDEMIVTRIPTGMTVVPMFQRPTKPGRVSAPTAPADSITQDPWTMLWLGDKLAVHFRLRRGKTGDFEAIVELREGEPYVEPGEGSP